MAFHANASKTTEAEWSCQQWADTGRSDVSQPRKSQPGTNMSVFLALNTAHACSWECAYLSSVPQDVPALHPAWRGGDSFIALLVSEHDLHCYLKCSSQSCLVCKMSLRGGLSWPLVEDWSIPPPGHRPVVLWVKRCSRQLTETIFDFFSGLFCDPWPMLLHLGREELMKLSLWFLPALSSERLCFSGNKPGGFISRMLA